MPKEEFFKAFESLYYAKKRFILNTLNDDDWLREDDIVIQFGKGIEGLEEKCKDVKIMLSHIYQCAVDLRDLSSKALSDLSDDMTANNQDLIRPSILLLHLLRIFYTVVEESDKKQLTPLIDKLEKDLRVNNKLIKTVPMTIPSMSYDNIGASLANVFSTLLNVAKETNIPLPPDIIAPTTEQFNEGIKNVMENPKIKNVLTDVTTSLNSGGDMGALLNNLMQNFLDPTTLKSMQESLIKTAEIARDNQK